MKNYDALCILNPTLTEEKIDELMARIEKKIKDNGGELINIQKMGMKRLPFTFSKHKRLKEGYYSVVEYKGIGKTTESVKGFLRLQESIIRHMVTVKPKPPVILENEIVPQAAVQIEAKPTSVENKELSSVEPQ
ncbi:30S ribosomal protein S6 [Candidatus Margulisiibacteriota bacterium]